MGRTSAYQLQVLERRLGPERTRLFEETTRAELEAAFASELTAVEGVEALLDELQRAGQPTCVASSGTHERMRTTLGLTGLEARFEGRVFSATQVAHGKPAPDLFLYAAEQMGASPSRCAVIEDSVFGVQAALAAGMTAFGYEGGLAPAGSLAEAGAQVFAHMSDLRDLLVGSRSPAG
jgi:HAD superfamily hydrolase (TIGR01509 family)